MKNRIQLYGMTSLLLLCVLNPLSSQSDSIATAPAKSIETLQRQFVELPSKSRRFTGPLFWLHGDESKERLEFYVEKVAEGGNGCFTTESRPHVDWLGKGWFRDLEICLNAAKRHNLQMWIFDERWWPSGEVGGHVPQQYGSKTMQAKRVAVEGGKFFTLTVPSEKLIALLAGQVVAGKVDGKTLVDLSDHIQNGKLNWEAPAGNWSVMTFTWRYTEKKSGKYFVDGASRAAVDWYLQTVFQPHYDRFKDDFGTWIRGFFYDEPKVAGDWGTEVIPVMEERGVDWRKALVAWKFELAGDEQESAKYQYQDAFAETWGRTLYGGVSAWCRERNVKSIGHFTEHRKLYLSHSHCAGNMFQMQKYSDMGGIDAIYAQFAMGQRWDPGNWDAWQTPKLASSISHVYGKPDDLTMVEIFGARGQDLTYPEMKWWTNQMHVSGVNSHIPHTFNPRAPYDLDSPPFFYNGGKEPRWPLYKVYADYTSRLSVMLTGGRHVCPVALLFLGTSHHVGRAVPPEQMTSALQDALYDCDWMPYEVFEKEVLLDKDGMKLHQERYRVLVVPPVEVIPHETLKKAHAFYQSGGVVVGYEYLPSKATEIGRTRQDIEKLRTAIWGAAQAGVSACKTNAAGGRSYFLPANPTSEQIQQILAKDAGRLPTLEVLEGETNNWLHVLHRQKDGHDIFFVCNQNIDGGRRTFRLQITAQGFPEYWDPMRGEISSIPFTSKGGKVELSLKLDPMESALLVFNSTQRDLPTPIEIADRKGLKVLNVFSDGPVRKVETQPTNKDVWPPVLEGDKWIWYPKPNASTSAAPGTLYFRQYYTFLPRVRGFHKAYFCGTADNNMTLYINGTKVESRSFGNVKRVANIDITGVWIQGKNTIAISASNTGGEPSAAGLIGTIKLFHVDGTSRTIRTDQNWRASNQLVTGWEKKDFDDSKWGKAVQVAKNGDEPWGFVGVRKLMVSPVKRAAPFTGHVELSDEILQGKSRCILHMKNVKPEMAVRISVNGKDVGGCIGSPLRKDITQHLTSGKNSIRIEPFTPELVQIVVCPM